MTCGRGRSTGDPVQHCCDVMRFAAVGQGGAVDHQHRQTKRARGDKLRLRPTAARILGHNQINTVGAHQRLIRSGIERAAIQNDMVIGQGRWHLWRVHKAQNIVMLGLCRETRQMHPAQGQQNTPRGASKCRDRRRNIGHAVPVIAGDRGPRGARQGQKRHPGDLRGLHGMCTHLRGERMGGVNQMGDVMGAQIGDQPLHPAKTTHPHRNGLWLGPLHPPCIAECGAKPRPCKFGDKARGLNRATKDKDIVHG
ncbi:hypothetical protein BD293_3540 [Roseinatronobacter monicus]|uniref:Uncharacterized protein n=1 Tax=Roseinatronobacter monicus TaxID=393481 RepID=A0A543KIF2_9RHOB|nr:hypothetical protein BD293_3540 [Roseinatronobacter monicus]